MESGPKIGPATGIKLLSTLVQKISCEIAALQMFILQAPYCAGNRKVFRTDLSRNCSERSQPFPRKLLEYDRLYLYGWRDWSGGRVTHRWRLNLRSDWSILTLDQMLPRQIPTGKGRLAGRFWVAAAACHSQSGRAHSIFFYSFFFCKTRREMSDFQKKSESCPNFETKRTEVMSEFQKKREKKTCPVLKI